MSIYRDYAEEYFNLGLRPTCISYLKTKYNITETNPEKSPCHSWRRWQVRKPDLSEIKNLPWDQSSGIGTVLGYGTRCIDIDNCNDVHLLKEFLVRLQLPEDYEWAVKTPNGFHIHVVSENLPFVTDKELHEGVLALLPNDSYKNKFKRIELRWANHAVLPPTVINGMSYNFVFLNGSVPKKRLVYLSAKILFSFLATYCGSNKEEEGTSIIRTVIINDIYFEIVHGSGYSSVPVQILAYKLLNINEALVDIEDNHNLIGMETGDYSKTYPGQDLTYYENYLDTPLFIDIETTGLIKDQTDYDSYPRIIQIATYSWDWNDPKFQTINNFYIKPDGFTVPKEIEELTGITNSFLLENGIPIHQALNSFIGKKITTPIICYNADFDISILDSEFMRLKKNNSHYIGNFFRDSSQIFCLMKKISSVSGGKYLKQSEAYEMLFKDPIPVKAHNAVNDLEVLIDCFNLMELYGYISLGNKGRTLI